MPSTSGQLREAEGIARAKVTNPEKYQGRPVSIDAERINALKTGLVAV